MPTKNAHHTHEDASGQNATLPIFVVDHAIRRISDKCLTCQTSQNISKMQRFSRIAKTRKKFSRLDSSKKRFSRLDCELQHAIQRNSNKMPTIFQRVNQAKHVQKATFFTRSKNKEKVQ